MGATGNQGFCEVHKHSVRVGIGTEAIAAGVCWGHGAASGGQSLGPILDHLERLPPQASRLDICCCLSSHELPPPRQSEGLLLRFFRKVYAPLLLHRVTRVVVVSGAGGSAPFAVGC